MSETREVKNQTAMKKLLLLINSAMLIIGGGGGPLITRLYFLHGGKRIWLNSILFTIGFPITLIPIFICYFRNRRLSLLDHNSPKPKMFSMTPVLFIAFSIIGVVTGLSNYLYAFGVARLPVSTSTILVSTNLVFLAVFAFLLVKQKFTFNSVNAIVLLLLGAGVLAMHSGSDRPAGESNKQYVIGFIVTLASAALGGASFPFMELMYKRTATITYSLVMELQMVLGFAGSIFCLVGMIIVNDFKVIPREAREFGLGEVNYYVIIVVSAIFWQFYLFGAIGTIFCSSSLFSGILVSVLLPITEVLAVIFYKESFKVEKGISLVLSLWGFVSYFYGEFKEAKKMRTNIVSETELAGNNSIHAP